MTYYDSFFGENITDPYEALQKRKREMRTDGYTDIQIDEMICEYSEHFGIDISLFDDEWVSDEYKELAKIREIEDEYEQDRQLQLIAEKIVEAEEQNEYDDLGNHHKPFTDEWYAEQGKKEPLIIRTKRFFKHPINSLVDFLDFDDSYDPMWISVPKFIAAYSLYLLFMVLLALPGVLICLAFGISLDWASMIISLLVLCLVIHFVEKKLKKG